MAEIKKQRIEMNFDGKFFKKEHVLLAAQDYSNSFWMFVDGSDENILAVLIPKEDEKIDKKLIKDEFYNYVLANVKNFQVEG